MFEEWDVILMEKKDHDVIKRLDAIMHELKEGRKETASTIVATPDKPSRFFLGKALRKWKWQLMILLAAVLLIIVSIAGVKHYLFSERTSVVEKGSFVEQMKDLSSLASAQAFVKAVIEKEDNEIFGKKIDMNVPGTKRKLLIIIPANVTAGVNLESLKEKDLKINEKSKTIELVLPKAEIIQEPTLEFNKVKMFSVEGVFRGEVNWEEAYQLADEAKEQVKKEAIQQGLLQTAEKNAKRTLTEFYQQLGYHVTIQFENK